MNQRPAAAGGAQRRQRRTVVILSLVVVGMFGFGFALVPLYQLVCSVTGANSAAATGRISAAELAAMQVDEARLVTVEFDATINLDLPWVFKPTVKRLRVHPGEISEVTYLVKNTSDRTIVAQAVPGITPWQATEHFTKTECFCFTQQTLAAGEEREMPVRFVISPALPAKYHTVTLSYTFMDTDRSGVKKADKHPLVQPAVAQVEG